MLERGIKVTVNSDDPAYHGYVDDNLDALTQAGPLTGADLVTLARNSIEASFADPGRKQQLANELGVAISEPDGKHRGSPDQPS
jgi:adenosine deaminase